LYSRRPGNSAEETEEVWINFPDFEQGPDIILVTYVGVEPGNETSIYVSWERDLL
jgi:hypothetical protein